MADGSTCDSLHSAKVLYFIFHKTHMSQQLLYSQHDAVTTRSDARSGRWEVSSNVTTYQQRRYNQLILVDEHMFQAIICQHCRRACDLKRMCRNPHSRVGAANCSGKMSGLTFL